MKATIQSDVQCFAIKAGTELLTNVTAYYMGAFGAERVDCKELTIEYGVKYAQYTDAIRVVYLEKGKRKANSRTLTYKPYLLVVNTTDAIAVRDCMDSLGGGCSQTRYATFDPRWMTDWQEASKDMPVLVLINKHTD